MKQAPHRPPAPAASPPVRPTDPEAAVPTPRRPPPMRVVTKGWWTLPEQRVDMEVLREQAAHDD